MSASRNSNASDSPIIAAVSLRDSSARAGEAAGDFWSQKGAFFARIGPKMGVMPMQQIDFAEWQ